MDVGGIGFVIDLESELVVEGVVVVEVWLQVDEVERSCVLVEGKCRWYVLNQSGIVGFPGDGPVVEGRGFRGVAFQPGPEADRWVLDGVEVGEVIDVCPVLEAGNGLEGRGVED